MFEGGILIQQFVAKLKALTRLDWLGKAGGAFKLTLTKITEFTQQHHLKPTEIADEAAVLGRRKIEGLARLEHANAMKAYAEAEEKKVDTELKSRTLSAKVRETEAGASKAESEARIAAIREFEARIELIRKCRELGVTLTRDEQNNIVRASLAPVSYPWHELERAVAKPSQPLEVLNSRRSKDDRVQTGRLVHRGYFIDIYTAADSGKWSVVAIVRADEKGLLGQDEALEPHSATGWRSPDEGAEAAAALAIEFIDRAVESGEFEIRPAKPTTYPKNS